MHTADALSRGTVRDQSVKTSSAQEEELEVYVDSILHSLPVSDRKMKLIAQETQPRSAITVTSGSNLRGISGNAC